ncbi:winged helix-turn-helix domain-containing protein [Labrys sp. LIt4]|uniref:winged helix-turn-helix domain-containing protein n=1 Tax=Labrys sp. LIt4 TaxID=2821355 RepID=UPI001AE080E8|nr:winged helix-turn-helix domain-containing protein [Labrys sp. LIt4]MBP0581561.1 winged helix-turn-helix domain-containing protein [Labrys sp. LIt4]
MQHRFGFFELDEDARALRLRGTVQKLQPRVFDLLVYLVRNAGRVVPKDELMDALWPNLNVTEASLQRAVSLARAALSAGGLENAIRSYVRHGYRFAIDEPSLGVAVPEFDAQDSNRARALALAKAKDWRGAAMVFESLDADGQLCGADIDVWALAVECQGRPAAAIPVLTRALAAYVAEGRPNLAARAAVTIAKLELERSAPAAASGWLGRAEALLGDTEDPRTTAYLLWMKARQAIFQGRAAEALELSSRSHSAAEACGDPGLIALTLVYMGFYNISLGHIEEGENQQNHAAAIALSSNVDPIFGSLVYCNILWSCRTFPDWSRARQWSEGFDSWSEASYATIPGACDLHRAEILGAQRDLIGALAAIDLALPKLSEEEAWSIGDGYRVRGDIRAMIGDLDHARQDYAAAYAAGWDAEPGNAVLLAETGQVEVALAALDRALAGASWYHIQRRGILLAHKMRISAMGGLRDIAAEALNELQAESGRWTQPAVHALINEAHYLLAGDSDAVRFLVLARQLWTSAGIEYHAARVRLELARVHIEAGDTAAARTEIAAAERTAVRIGSRRLRMLAAEIQQKLISAPPSPWPHKDRPAVANVRE